MDFLWFILIGGVAGFLAGQVMKGKGFGIIKNIIVGIIGGFLGGWLFGLAKIDVGGGLVGALITALIGSMVLIAIANLVMKKK